MKVVITGGHISPALSVIKKLRKVSQIYFMGRKFTYEGDTVESFEYKICQDFGIKFIEIDTGRLQRKFTKYTIPSIFRFPKGLIKSAVSLKKLMPDIVLCFGGYIGLPVCVVAYLQKIPVVLHEQTQKAGLSNTIISYFADKVCISFESSRKYFPADKTVLTGNPVREEIFEVKENLTVPPGLKIIYITGGSGGSHFINSQIAQIIPEILEKYAVILQTGNSTAFDDFETLNKIKNNLEKDLQGRLILKHFILPHQIGWVYKNADLVIGRSGINTVSELIVLHKKCLLIPLPHAQSGEQLDNAKLVEKLGIGEYLEQKDVTPKLLVEQINKMISKNIQTSKKDTDKYVFKDSDAKIINVLKSVYEQKKAAQKI